MMKINQVVNVKRMVLIVALLLSLPGHAFVLGGTRVVLKGQQSVTLPVISSDHDGTLLIRAKVFRDVSGYEPVSDVLVSPPVSRLEMKGKNMLRIMMLNAASYPQDRESVLYLSVSGLPSSNPLSPDRGKVSTAMVLGTGNIIKLFYRPDGLPAVTNSTWGAIQATRAPGGISVTNPTPFHITFMSLTVDGQPVKIGKAGEDMLPPFGHRFFAAKSVTKKALQWSVINDLGGVVKGETPIR